MPGSAGWAGEQIVAMARAGHAAARRLVEQAWDCDYADVLDRPDLDEFGAWIVAYRLVQEPGRFDPVFDDLCSVLGVLSRRADLGAPI